MNELQLGVRHWDVNTLSSVMELAPLSGGLKVASAGGGAGGGLEPLLTTRFCQDFPLDTVEAVDRSPV